MPQMYPMNWLLLYTLFLIIFLMINIMNYFIFLPQSSPFKKKMFKLQSNSWMW